MPEQAIRIRSGQVASLRDRCRRAAAACRPFPTPAHESAADPRPGTEDRLIRAYLTLFVTPPDGDGAKVVSLARFGSYEVRLYEPPEDHDIFPLRIELYTHERRTALDSCGCDGLEVAVAAANDFMLRAAQLNEASGQFRRAARLRSLCPAAKP